MGYTCRYMDELHISGKRFISSRRIARDNGYTSDYIGQLIRGGKVIGQKVGRAWYVDASSFDAFLGEEGTSVPVEATQEPAIQKSSDLLSSPQPGEAGQTFVLQVPAPVAESAPVVMMEEKTPAPEILPAVEEPTPIPAPAPAPAPVAVEEIVKEEGVQHIPLRLVKTQTPGGLKYYADDTPSLPEIRSDKRESRIAEPESLMEEEPVSVEPQQARRAGKGPLLALALAGVTVFIFSAVVSSAMSLNLSIEAGTAAVVSYKLNW